MATRLLAPDVLTLPEIGKVLEACGPGFAGIRNRALLATLWRAGLRCGEALALELRDCDLEQRTLRVRRSKTAAGLRVVAVDDGLADRLTEWLSMREQNRLVGAPLFCTRAGAGLNSRYIRALCTRLAAQTGIGKRLHPHGLRHAHAVELLAEGVPLPMIRDQLGHSSIAITDAYLRRIDPRERLAATRHRSW